MKYMSPEQVQIYLDFLSDEIEREDKRRGEANSEGRYELANDAEIEGARLQQTLNAFIRILDGDYP